MKIEQKYTACLLCFNGSIYGKARVCCNADMLYEAFLIAGKLYLLSNIGTHSLSQMWTSLRLTLKYVTVLNPPINALVDIVTSKLISPGLMTTSGPT